jgi:V/A-type H+-transporting ATPase subunit I
MARDKVVKAEILCHSTRKEEVLAVLEITGRVHLIDISVVEDAPFFRPEEIERSSLHTLSVSLDKTIPFLQSRELSKKREAVPAVTVDELSSLLDNHTALEEKANRSVSISDELINCRSKSEDIQRKIDFLEEWADFPLHFNQLVHGKALTMKAGHVSAGEGVALLERLKEQYDLFHITELSGDRFVVAWHNEINEEIHAGLAESGFVAADFTGFSGTPEEELNVFRESLAEVHKRIEELSVEADLLVQSLPRLKTLSDAAGLQALREEAASRGRVSSSSLLLHLWLRQEDVAGLKTELEKLGEVDVSLTEAQKEESPPVFLTESASADPYLMLTDMYGRPDGADPDPTPLMAPFYAIFFGICVGDAGYGISLAAGAAIGWYLTNKKQGNTRLFRLMFQGGLASVVWGFLLGGWFGMPFNSLPTVLQNAAMPLNNLVPGYSRGETDGFALSQQFLYLTLGFGLIQLGWGIIVNLKKRLAAGEGVWAVVDQTGWMLALLGLFPWLFNHYLLNGALYPLGTVWDNVFLGMLAVGAVLIFIMGGKEAEGIGGKAGLGAYACYGIVNLLGDVLSYSRLFALALSSAIVASVINDIAGMLQSIPVFGIVLTVLVLVAGHLFNLAMAALSGFIHTARLQFVEFFGKFYDGTGVPFKALRYEPRYVRIKR